MNRLFGIVYILLDKGNVTANYLARHFEVSVRTIYRDIETLCMSGIPIYSSRGKSGGISILENFVIDKSYVSNEEQMQILAALQSVKEADKSNSYGALLKLSSIFKVENPNWISIDFSDWSDQQQYLFNLIKNSILKRSVLRFDYYNRYGQLSTRDVEPIKLWFKSNTWFLKAYCRYKQCIRVFKLTRIKRIKCLEETFDFKKHDDYSDDESFSGTKLIEYIDFTLKVDNCMAYRVYDMFEEHQIIYNEDGSFTVNACFPKDEWIYGTILSFGNYAKIISPDYLRQEIIERFKNALDNYK